MVVKQSGISGHNNCSFGQRRFFSVYMYADKGPFSGHGLICSVVKMLEGIRWKWVNGEEQK